MLLQHAAQLLTWKLPRPKTQSSWLIIQSHALRMMRDYPSKSSQTQYDHRADLYYSPSTLGTHHLKPQYLLWTQGLVH